MQRTKCTWRNMRTLDSEFSGSLGAELHCSEPLLRLCVEDFSSAMSPKNQLNPNRPTFSALNG